MEALKIICIVAGFIVAVGILGWLSAKINGVELGEEPGQMSERSRILWGLFRPIWILAEWVSRPFRRKR